MIDFDTAPVQFRVRGARYFLEALSLDDAERMAAQEGASQVEQIIAMKEIVAVKARSKWPTWWLRVTGRPSPAEAVRSLSVLQQARLFGEWMAEYRGVGPGESSGSAA